MTATKIPDKQLERWQSVSRNCDHKKMTEVHDEYKVCFCTKLMHVTAMNNNCTTQEFSEQLIELSYKNIDWNEVNRLVSTKLDEYRRES